MTLRAIGLSLGCFAAACAGGSRVLPPAGNTAYGVYVFQTNVPNMKPALVLEGTVVLLPDTLTMTLKGSACAVNVNVNQPTIRRGFSYRCGDVTFHFDRENPLRRNSYVTTTTTWVNNRVCITWTPNRTGGETCTRYGTERVEKEVPVYGNVEFLIK